MTNILIFQNLPLHPVNYQDMHKIIFSYEICQVKTALENKFIINKQTFNNPNLSLCGCEYWKGT